MRGGFSMLATLVLVAGCVTTPSADLDTSAATMPAGLDAEGFAPLLFDDMEFRELDLAIEGGLRVHADVYLPTSPTQQGAPETFPTILLLSPYWGTGTRGSPELGYMPYDFLVERLLPRGYAVVYGDLAGNGGSSGCWDFMGPVERQSAVAMVNAIAAQEWSDGKVGMMGLSYDGMTQIMAASDAPEALVTVVPAAPLTSAYSGLRMNGAHYGGGWHSTIAGYETSTLTPPVDPFGADVNEERMPGWMETVARSPQCMAENHEGDATGAYNDYYAARDYRALGANVKASVFYIQGFLDPAVKPDNYGEWFQGVPTMKKAWLGFWYHQYPTAELGGRDDLYLTLHRWFDFTLKGIPNGIDAEPVVDVQDSLGRWRHEAAWPPTDLTLRALQLSADGALVESGAKEGDVTFGGPLAATDLLMGSGEGRAVFGELAFPKGLHIAGAPMLNLTLASDRPNGLVIARLYEGERLVTQGAYNLLFAGGLDEPAPLTPGEPVAVAFALYPTDWRVADGAALRVELSTLDARGWFDSDAPAGRLTLHAGEEAILTLPTIERANDAVFLTSCGKRLGDIVDDCFQDLDDKGVDEDQANWLRSPTAAAIASIAQTAQNRKPLRARSTITRPIWGRFREIASQQGL